MREPANIDAIIDLMDRTPEEMDAQNVPAPVRDRIYASVPSMPGGSSIPARQTRNWYSRICKTIVCSA